MTLGMCLPQPVQVVRSVKATVMSLVRRREGIEEGLERTTSATAGLVAHPDFILVLVLLKLVVRTLVDETSSLLIVENVTSMR